MDGSLTLESDYSLDYFRLFSLQALKQFLSVRKKSTVGSFETLVARYGYIFFQCLILSLYTIMSSMKW